MELISLSQEQNLNLDLTYLKKFQKEFQEGAIIKSLEFKNTYMDEVFTGNGMESYQQLYDVRIEVDRTCGLHKDRNLKPQFGMSKTGYDILE